MSLRCPVITSDRASLQEVAADAAAYFNPEDPDDIRRTLETTLSHSATLARLMEAGTARAALFSWERCAVETLDAYHQVE